MIIDIIFRCVNLFASIRLIYNVLLEPEQYNDVVIIVWMFGLARSGMPTAYISKNEIIQFILSGIILLYYSIVSISIECIILLIIFIYWLIWTSYNNRPLCQSVIVGNIRFITWCNMYGRLILTGICTLYLIWIFHFTTFQNVYEKFSYQIMAICLFQANFWNLPLDIATRGTTMEYYERLHVKLSIQSVFNIIWFIWMYICIFIFLSCIMWDNRDDCNKPLLYIITLHSLIYILFLTYIEFYFDFIILDEEKTVITVSKPVKGDITSISSNNDDIFIAS